MKIKFFILYLFLLSQNCFSQILEIKNYKKMLLKNAENLDNYQEGQVFLENREDDTLFPLINSDSGAYSIPCQGRSETRKTILESGIDDDSHSGRDKDERYYLLEEKTFWLNSSAPNFSRCKEHFGKEIIETKKITMEKKNRISLRNFKRLFNQKIYEFYPLGKDRIKIIREGIIIRDDAIYCGPIYWAREIPKIHNFIKEDRFMPFEVVQDLNRPWEFVEERVFQIPTNKVVYTRKRLPNIDPRTLDNQIMDVEVDLGSYSYPLTEGCKKEFSYPILIWRNIINWRPHWPRGQ